MAGHGEEMSPFVMRYGHFVDSRQAVIDEVTAVFMPEKRSYTGLAQAEIFCHGGRQVVTLILQEVLASGARAAEPGEFTRLAFMSGRIDLARAEAVAEIVAANTEHSYSAARDHLLGTYTQHISDIRGKLIGLIAEIEASVDFPEEDISPDEKNTLLESAQQLTAEIDRLMETYRGGKIVNEGYKIAIAGRPNAGKSSLFNQLLKQERALVTPTPGTTRDYLSEWIDLEGFAVNIIDTAGLRKAGGTIEKAGQTSAKKIIADCDLVIWMIDLTQRKWREQLFGDIKMLGHNNIISAQNKIDLVDNVADLKAGSGLPEMVATSCLTGRGIKGLKKVIVQRINEKMPDLTSGVMVTSARHRQKLAAARKALKSARQKIKLDESPELTAFDLRQAASALDEITGKVYNEDILKEIFSRFCIGK